MTPTDVINAVCEAFGVSRMDLLSQRRHRHLADARIAVSVILRETTPLSYPRIGQLLNRDHTTVLHHLRKLEERLEDPVFRQCFAEARDRVSEEIEIPKTEPTQLERTIEAMREEIAALRAGNQTRVIFRTVYVNNARKARPPTMAELIADQERETREKLHG